MGISCGQLEQLTKESELLIKGMRHRGKRNRTGSNCFLLWVFSVTKKRAAVTAGGDLWGLANLRKFALLASIDAKIKLCKE